MERFRLVTLDMVGTVIRFSRPPVAEYQAAAARRGLNMELTPLQQSFNRRWAEMNRDFPHFGSTSGLSSQAWWERLVKETYSGVLAPGQQDPHTLTCLASELYTYYRGPEPYLVTQDGLETLQKLSQAGTTVGVISNFDTRLLDILPALGLSKYIDFVVTSEEARSSKPEPAIFEIARRQSGLAGLQVEQILHIGDDLDRDYLGARGLGWSAVLVDRWGGGYTTVDQNHVLNIITDIFNPEITGCL